MILLTKWPNNFKKIVDIDNETTIGLGTGNFDDYCVYIVKHNINGCISKPPSDYEYFGRMREVSKTMGANELYNLFIQLYDVTTKDIDLRIINNIIRISNDKQFIIDLISIYLGMVAEINKENAILGKRIKRLGMYQTLFELNLNIHEVAQFSRGKKYDVLDKECRNRGF